MDRNTIYLILVLLALWYFFLRSKAAAAGTVATVNGQPSGTGTPLTGTVTPSSAGQGLSSPQGSMPSLNEMAGWGGQTYTTQPGATAPQAALPGTSFPGDDMMCLS
jgi:hypothetical protein